MIQIQHPNQFTKAAERLQRERMGVRRSEAHLYAVTNKAKGVTYNVRFTRHDGNLFASCDCPARELRRGAPHAPSPGFASNSEQGQKGNEPPTW